MSATATDIDFTVFNKVDSKSSTDLNESFLIKRILTLLKYYQILNVNTDKNNQSIFINFITTTYTVSDIIMDYHQLKKQYGQPINDIMKIAKEVYKIKVYDIKTCPHSSRLYRVNDQSAELNIFDEEDTDSPFKVVMDIIDGIYHFIFHIYESGLRFDHSNTSNYNGGVMDNKNKTSEEHYDADYARLSARIRSTRDNTARFDRINTSNKFNINIGVNDISNTDIVTDEYDVITYLDSIYSGLIKAGVKEEVIDSLSNYVLSELFDTEGLEIDLGIDKGGNIENNINNKICIDFINTMFQKATSLVSIYCDIYCKYIVLTLIVCILLFSVSKYV